MEEKKKNNIFLRVLLVLFILFLCLYSVSKNGYVRTINLNKTLYTEDQLKKFEDDVLNKEFLDLKDYKLNQDIDYSNKVSDIGEAISDVISNTASKSLKFIDKIFSSLFM